MLNQAKPVCTLEDKLAARLQGQGSGWKRAGPPGAAISLRLGVQAGSLPGVTRGPSGGGDRVYTRFTSTRKVKPVERKGGDAAGIASLEVLWERWDDEE